MTLTSDSEPTAEKVSKVEIIKRESSGLLGTLADEFAAPTDHIGEEATQLIKFHGVYQQDDRDQRAERRAQKLDRAYMFMARTKFPGGRLTAEQYLLADELSDSHGNGTLRITTRQDFQFHGVGKQKLKGLIRALNERWMTTYGGCGDIARNTLTCPVADLLPGVEFDFQDLALQVSNHFLADSTAYYELWCDGEKIMVDGTRQKVEPKREESFYGKTYMPRKHKMAIGLPGDNCIDVFTNDVALETVVDDDGTVRGFNLLAGGGLGSTHGQKQTYPRLGSRIGFVPVEDALPVLEAATAVYRDSGDRANRRHARLKYVIEERGVAWYREQVEAYLGRPIQDPVAVGEYRVDDHVGWARQADGRWLVGVWVENGRIKDTPARRWKSGLREIIARFKPEPRLTAQQNIVLANIDDAQRPAIAALLARYGLDSGDGSLSAIRRFAMACPALPTCGLAVAESERYLPDLIGELEARGYGDERIWVRMSGCPNACSRPPTAELGLVGRSLRLYTIYVGGSFEGLRLTQLYKDNVRADVLADELASLIDLWRRERQADEAFGDFCHRLGPDALRERTERELVGA
jgi:sulfite reductase beta subunit-like hemoprotein